MMELPTDSFLASLDRFRESVKLSSGSEFVSFREGLPATWEAYKPKLRMQALQRLKVDDWAAEQIGSGVLLERAILAVEINEQGGLRNNLVRWENRYGHANRSHHKLLDARDSADTRRALEQCLFDLFLGRTEHASAGANSSIGEVFARLQVLVGSRYDLLAYFYFLLDSERFMPIAPATFDEAFERLGFALTTSRKCSWENYQAYNQTLHAVREALVEHTGLQQVNLIDAHSFCWMLVKVEGHEQRLTATPGRKKGANRDPGRSLDPREIAVAEMVSSVENTVLAALGPPVARLPKPKELRMSRHELERYIKTLLERQQDRCALTGIALQFNRAHVNHHLLPSLDRIDSNGHYEVGNLQVVCQFINFWKGSFEDEVFRDLLGLVRGESVEH